MKVVHSAQVCLPVEGTFHGLKLMNGVLAIYGTGIVLYEHDHSRGMWLNVKDDKVCVLFNS